MGQILSVIHRTARVSVLNGFDAHLRVQVLHQYTGENTEDSGWIVIAPGAQVEVMTVNYRTGDLTTGRDNWIVNATQLSVVEGRTGVGPFNIEGRAMFGILRYQTGHGFLAQWKLHTLRPEDEGMETVIVLRPSIAEFKSPSGTSSTTFDLEMIPHVV